MPSITVVVVLSALIPGGATEWRSGSRRRCSDGSSDADHEARRLDDECPRTRGCNSPQPYSTMSLDESSPTYFSSAGFPPDLEAAVARGVDLAAGFLGRVGPVPVVMMELEKDASAYASMTAAVKAWKGFGFDIQEEVDDAMDRTCQGREEDHCQDQCSWDDDDEICRKNEAYYASSRSSCMCGGYAIEYVPLFFAIHGDKETPKNIQQRAIHEYAHAFQFSRGGVWANFLVEGGAVLLECVVGEYYDDWGGDLEPWAYCLREVARNALEVYAYDGWTRAVPSKAALGGLAQLQRALHAKHAFHPAIVDIRVVRGLEPRVASDSTTSARRARAPPEPRRTPRAETWARRRSRRPSRASA